MGHRVTLKPSAHGFEVPEGQSILQAGLDAGFMMPYSCRTGVCRTCRGTLLDRKSTRLNSSHGSISYAVFCLKKKNDTGKRGRARLQGYPCEGPTPSRIL